MPDTPIVFSDALRALGSSPEEVAQSLRQEGVRGVRNAVRTLNPIVRYLATKNLRPAADFDMTGGPTLRFFSTRTGKLRELSLPEPVIDFLEAFNRGDHPDLEMPPEAI